MLKKHIGHWITNFRPTIVARLLVEFENPMVTFTTYTLGTITSRNMSRMGIEHGY